MVRTYREQPNDTPMFTTRQIDTHGMTVLQAETIFDKLLSEIRLKREEVEVTFVTGTGLVQLRLKDLATANDLNFYVPLNNRGVLVVEFE